MTKTSNSDGSQTKVEHYLPLEEDPSEHKLTKANSNKWDLLIHPTVANSTTKYCCTTRILEGTESTRQIIRWMDDVRKVWTGLNATDVASREPIVLASMRSQPTAIFAKNLTELAQGAYNTQMAAAQVTDQANGNTVAVDALTAAGVDSCKTVAHLDICLQALAMQLMPRQVLAKAQKQLRREMRKPVGMNIRTYWQNIVRVNEELTKLPPFGPDQKFKDGDVLETILFGTPKSWHTEADRQQFDPMVRGLGATIQFFESIESAENLKPKDTKKSDGKKPSKKHDSSSQESPAKKQKQQFYCELHGKNWTHDTSDCRTKKAQDKGESKSFGNKTWQRKAESEKKEANKELAALVTKAVKKTVKQELKSMAKKRSSSSSDDDGENYLAEVLDGNLDGFNYDDMENLSVDGDTEDEIEV